MQALRQFSIPIKGLKTGLHEFKFEIDQEFFKSFENSPVKSGLLNCALAFDKKDDHILLNFETQGSVVTTCDRCTSKINLPLSSDYEIIVKYGEGNNEMEEVYYLDPDAHEINVASLIYEQIVLALPMIKVYDCEVDDPRPCNVEILSILSEESEQASNPLGDALKNLKIDKND